MNKLVMRGEGFTQLELASGERVLVSVSKQGLRVSKLWFGVLPVKKLFDRSGAAELDAALMRILDWEGGTVLDKLAREVSNCRSASEVERRLLNV